ncbi:MAG: GAF domain-containing protein [Bacteroidales bacterium]|nr:GAF domain-containing protein [Bacteroidales bacterium]
MTKAAHRLVPDIADWCALDQVEKDGSFRCLAAIHANPAKTAALVLLKNNYTADPENPYGLYKAAQSSKSVLLPQVDKNFIDQISKSAEHRELINTVGLKSAIIIPLFAHGKIFGTLTLAISDSENNIPERILISLMNWAVA